MTDELKGEIDAIRSQCEALSLFVVSAEFDREKMPVVLWKPQESSERKPFLELAKRMGVSLIVLEQFEFEEDTIEHLRPEQIETEDFEEEDEEGKKDEGTDRSSQENEEAWIAIKRKYERYYGHMCAYLLHWVKDGVCYSFDREASWYQALAADVEELEGKLEAETKEVEKAIPELTDEEVEEIASKLASDEFFQKATNNSARQYALKKRFPEVFAQHPGRVSEIVNQAKGKFELEIRPELEKALDRNISTLCKDGLSKEQIAKRLKVSISRVKRAL